MCIIDQIIDCWALMQLPGPLPSLEVSNPKRSGPTLTGLLWVASVASARSSPATRRLLKCLCPKVCVPSTALDATGTQVWPLC